MFIANGEQQHLSALMGRRRLWRLLVSLRWHRQREKRLHGITGAGPVFGGRGAAVPFHAAQAFDCHHSRDSTDFGAQNPLLIGRKAGRRHTGSGQEWQSQHFSKDRFCTSEPPSAFMDIILYNTI